MTEIKIVITMDCEPSKATTHPGATGPSDWDLGARAVNGYAEIADVYGFPVTYFLHPETAVAQSAIFRSLESKGACLGLHMHPWKYSMWRYQGKEYMAHFGALTEIQQRELLVEASEVWREAIGYIPRYFRPGTFSANDNMFKVLADLGFLGGSCSAPGRMMPEVRAVWTGGEPDPHRANATFRQARGTLPFANVPISADRSQLLNGSNDRKLHPDLRPDTDWEAQYGITPEAIARNIVSQVVSRTPAVPTLCFISHNHFDYESSADPARQRYVRTLSAICAACKEAGLRPVGATLQQVVDEVLSGPCTPEEFTAEGDVLAGKPLRP
jgi:hypothetical protein